MRILIKVLVLGVFTVLGVQAHAKSQGKELSEKQLQALPQQCFVLNASDPGDFFFLNKNEELSRIYKVSDQRDYFVTDVKDEREEEGPLTISGVIQGDSYAGMAAVRESWVAQLNQSAGSLIVTLEQMSAQTVQQGDETYPKEISYKVFCAESGLVKM